MLMNKNTQAQTDTRRLRLGAGGEHAELMEVVVGWSAGQLWFSAGPE